jgi:hypothetical protein
VDRGRRHRHFKGYRYTSTVGRWWRFKVSADKLSVKAKGAAWGYTLDETSQGAIAVQLRLGSGVAWCASALAKASGNRRRRLPNDRMDRFVGPTEIAAARELSHAVATRLDVASRKRGDSRCRVTSLTGLLESAAGASNGARGRAIASRVLAAVATIFLEATSSSSRSTIVAVGRFMATSDAQGVQVQRRGTGGARPGLLGVRDARLQLHDRRRRSTFRTNGRCGPSRQPSSTRASGT